MPQIHKILLGSALAITAVSASAGVVHDRHGNEGYDTIGECNQAIANGTAKFYKPSTNHKPLLRKGEASVDVTTLGNVSPDYAKGACDVGTARRGGRDGVSKILQGKYIPYSPNMKVNAYLDPNGNLVRISMNQCDNWFSGDFPKPFKAPVVPCDCPTPKVTPKPTVTPKPVVPAGAGGMAGAGAGAGISAVTAASGSASILPILAGVAGVAAVTAIVTGGDNDSSTGTTGTVAPSNK